MSHNITYNVIGYVLQWYDMHGSLESGFVFPPKCTLQAETIAGWQ